MPLSELLAASDVISLHAPVDPARLRALLADHALVRLPNVLVTPHIAYNTQEAVDRIIESTLGNIEAYAAGAARNVVTAIMPASPSPGGGQPARRRTIPARRRRILPQSADARFRDQAGAAVRFHARRRLSESLPAVRRSIGGSRATDRAAAWK